MGLTEAAGRLAGTFSGGMLRRLELAQSLISAPRLLVLDEPTVGLDPIARGVVWEYIAKLRTEHRMTVLMTTHYVGRGRRLLRPDLADAPWQDPRHRQPGFVREGRARAGTRRPRAGAA
jgi:ABC-type thiamine transport system ATPase subunit